MTRKTVQTTRRAFSGSLAALPLAAGGLIGLAAPAIGQTKYPNKPVTIVLPFGAGVSAVSGGQKVAVVTLDSPLGKALSGKRSGDLAELPRPGGPKEFEFLGVF